ncbi:MAG: AI-2E family transporter [Candidatus Kapaibacterium sp.]
MPEETAKERNFWKPIKVTALIAISLTVLYLVKPVAHVLILFFASILFAVFLCAVADFFQKKIKVPRIISILVSIIVIFSIPTLIVWLYGPSVAEQALKLGDFAEKAFNNYKDWLSQYEWGRLLLSEVSHPQKIIPIGSDVVLRITDAFSQFLGAMTNFLIIFLLGVYLSHSPDVYINNLIKLFPRERRSRMHEVVAEIGGALRKWLIGRFASMLIIGVMVAVAYWIIDLPLAGILGIIAAIVSFIPYVGPIIAAFPAMLVAVSEDPATVLYVVLVYTFVQILESYLITPMIQMKAVHLPPAMLIGMQILMGVLMGAWGVLLATPFVVCVIVIIQMLYVHDVLGDKIRILGKRI